MARVVANGFMQKPGIDFAEVSAPTVRADTVHMVLAHAMNHKFGVRRIDMRTAFLNGEPQEEVYMTPPPGSSCSPQEMWRLRKALYGLRQAAQAWNNTWTEAMGFKVSDADPCLFYIDFPGSKRMYVVLHVDDALLVGNVPDVDRAVSMISVEFEIKDEGYVRAGKVNTFLGIELTIREGLGLVMSQTAYARDVLTRFGMQSCKPKPAPLPRDVQFPSDSPALPEDNEFSSMIGALLYLALHTRPDIAYAVSLLSRFVASPTQAHLESAKHVLRYLARDPAAGLIFPFVTPARRSNWELKVFSDADFAGDKTSSKSTTGVLVQYNRCAIMWLSKLQPIVAKSTCEAEYVAADTAVTEIMWLRKLAADLSGYTWAVPLCIDNQAALTLTDSDRPRVTGRTKHMDLRFNFVRDHVMKKEVVPRFVPTDRQLADAFTKALNGAHLKRMARDIGMIFSEDIAEGREENM